MKLNSKYTWAWFIWLLAFGAIEFAAIQDKRKGDTLSEHVWKLIGTKTENKSTRQWIFRLGLLGLFAWLISHFMTGWTWFKSKVKR